MKLYFLEMNCHALSYHRIKTEKSANTYGGGNHAVTMPLLHEDEVIKTVKMFAFKSVSLKE